MFPEKIKRSGYNALLLCVIPTFLFSILHAPSSYCQETTRIVLERANSWEYNKETGPDVQRIIGNVIFRHDSALLFCDSAYLNEKQNTVRAFGNVHVKNSDTLNLFGDSLFYDGNTKIARIKSNVILKDTETTLTTDTLVFDRKTRIASYNCWGKIVSGKNVLVSKNGYYYTDPKNFYFQDRVVLMNPEYIMRSDTLEYNTVTEVAYFFGPSSVKGEEDSIYCENGWYDTRNDIARFRKNSKIFRGSQWLTGDSLYYEKATGFGQVFRHAILADTAKDIVLKGNYGEIRRALGNAFMTDSAVAIMIDNKDSLYLHSDTIFATFDKQKEEENIKNIFCYWKVKFYRTDLQGMCDSLVYHGIDSTIFMYRDPVLWSASNQITGDTIRMVIRKGSADSLVVASEAFIISRDSTDSYNQVRGRDMVGYFRNNEIYKIRVLGNAETLYYVREEDKTLIGINKAYSSDMLIFIENGQVSSITYISQPVATLYPEKQISQYDLKLKGFVWIEGKRPLTKFGIFH